MCLRRATCLLSHDTCIMLGAVILSSDFNKAFERETPSSEGERNNFFLEAAVTHANAPCPTFGITPLCGACGEPNCKIGLIVAGFMVLHESQTQWLIVSDGSIKVVLAVSGLSATEQTWHYEQWLHLKIAGRKCRRELSPADSKSRQKIVLRTDKRTIGVTIGLLRKLLLATCAGLLFNLYWLHRIDVPTSTVGMFCLFFLSSLGDLAGSSLLVSHFGSRLATLGLTSLAGIYLFLTSCPC